MSESKLTDLELAAIEYQAARMAWRDDGSPLVGPTKRRLQDAHLLLCAEAMTFHPELPPEKAKGE